MEFLKKNIVSILLWVCGLILAGFNIYSQMTVNTASLGYRVTALENYQTKIDPLVNQIPLQEQRQLQISEDVKDIKLTVNNLDEKLDSVIQNRAITKATIIAPSLQIPSAINSPLAGQSASFIR